MEEKVAGKRNRGADGAEQGMRGRKEEKEGRMR